MTEENSTPKVNIGEKLRSAREKAGLSIDAVQKDTKIQKKYLVALENNDFAALPGKFYVRAFVKAFANAVGLNGDQFVHQYLPEENFTGAVKADTQPVKDQVTTSSRVVRPTNSESENKPNINFRKYLPIGVIVVIVVIVLAVVGFAVVKTHNDSSNAAPANSKVTVSNEDTKKKSTPKKKATKKNSLKKGETKIDAVKDSTTDFNVQTGDETSKLDLGATQAANATVKVNGNQVWSGALAANLSHTVDLPKDTKDVNISLTNAPVSNVKLNGKAVVMAAPAQGQSAMQRQMNLKFNN